MEVFNRPVFLLSLTQICYIRVFRQCSGISTKFSGIFIYLFLFAKVSTPPKSAMWHVLCSSLAELNERERRNSLQTSGHLKMQSTAKHFSGAKALVIRGNLQETNSK